MLIGLVGKPSVGKSTFFKAATLAEVEIASYPFTTIKPNDGVGFVKVDDPAKDFDKVSNPRDGFVVKDKRFVPVQLMDVAGLVPGAHKGEGMGNQFLDDLRQADVLIHVIDVSGSTKNGIGGTSVGDVNNDGFANSILDAELVAFDSLNESLANPEKARVGIVVFGSEASIVDVGGTESNDYTTPKADN